MLHITHPTTLRPVTIARLLEQQGSPLAPLSEEIFDLAMAYRIDAAFALAQCMVESQLGCLPLAQVNRNAALVRVALTRMAAPAPTGPLHPAGAGARATNGSESAGTRRPQAPAAAGVSLSAWGRWWWLWPESGISGRARRCSLRRSGSSSISARLGRIIGTTRVIWGHFCWRWASGCCLRRARQPDMGWLSG
jgi:hypothetical protein